MKIDSGQPYASTASIRKKRASSQVSGFSGFLDGAGETESSGATENSAPAAPLSDVGQMLLLQEVSDEEAHRKKAVRHAHLTLDALDDLRTAILMGDVSERQLQHIASIVTQQRQLIVSPHLQQVLDDIELRVAVELAKFEMGDDY